MNARVAQKSHIDCNNYILCENIHYLSSLLEKCSNATVLVKACANIFWYVSGEHAQYVSLHGDVDESFCPVPYQNAAKNVTWCIPAERVTCCNFPPIHPSLYEDELNSLEYHCNYTHETALEWNYEDPLCMVAEDTVYVYRPFPLKYIDIYKIENDGYIELPLT